MAAEDAIKKDQSTADKASVTTSKPEKAMTLAEEYPNPVSFRKLFSQASNTEFVLLAIGIIGSMGAGFMEPVSALVFSDVIGKVGETTTGLSMDAVIDAIYRLIVVGGISLTCATCSAFGLRSFCNLYVRRVRIIYFNALLMKNMDWYDTHSIVGLPGEMADDIGVIEDGFGDKLGASVMGLTAVVGGLCIAMVWGWQLAVVLLAALPFLILGTYFMAKSVNANMNESQTWYSQAAEVVEESLHSLRTVAAFGGEKQALQIFTDACEKVRKGGVKHHFQSGMGLGFLFGSACGAYGLAFYWGMWLRYNETVNPTTDEVWVAGDILGIFFCIFMSGFMAGNIEPGVTALQKSRKSAARLYGVLEDVPAKMDGQSEGQRIQSIERIDFVEVHFNYPSKPDVPVLRGLNLEILKGQKVALVGESGCGKSTVVSLLEQFYLPGQGVVKINGIDAKQINKKSLRGCIGYVGQEPVLFAGTVRENILSGCPSASAEDLDRVIDEVQLGVVVKNLPNGLDTFVGTGGSQFSGGQKQRIAIARALIGKPSLLLLDEATSALDNNSERAIQATLDRIGERLQGAVTMLSIAHRFSTIRRSDCIFVMKAGQVVEKGTHQHLLSFDGEYKVLASTQAAASPETLSRQVSDEQAASNNVGNQGPASGEHVTTEQVAAAAEEDTDVVKKEGELSEEEAEKKALKKYKPPMRRLLAFNKPEWPFYVPGLIGATFAGALMPLISVFLVDALDALVLPLEQKEEMRDELELAARNCAFLGAGALIAYTLQIGCLNGIAGEALSKRFRVALLTNLFRQEIGYHDDPKNAPGILANALQLYAFRVATLLNSWGSQAAVFCSVAVGLFIAFINCWLMAAIMMLSLPVIIGASVLQMMLLMGGGAAGDERMHAAQQSVTDAVLNPKTVQALGAEDKILGAYQSALNGGHQNKKAQRKAILKQFVAGLAFGVAQATPFFVIAGAMWVAVKIVEGGRWNFAEVMKAIMGIFYAGFGAGMSMTTVGDAAKAKPAAYSAFQLLDRKSEIDGLNPTGDTPPANFQAGNITFENVHFHYPFRQEVQVLKGASFKITAGLSVGLVGPSGGGKSTIMALLQRFYDPVSGHVLLGDGVPLKSLNIRWWRQQVGFVGQEPVLFNTSVRENVLYGVPEGQQVSEERLEECRKSANVDFLGEENGKLRWNLEVGPKGGRLSGGQKQRVAICRALVRDPPVLLLDEATSALDTRSEQIVQQALERARAGRTSFAIAHRLSTIQDCDLILVVGEGRILESGTHQELLTQGGTYSVLHAAQYRRNH